MSGCIIHSFIFSLSMHFRQVALLLACDLSMSLNYWFFRKAMVPGPHRACAFDKACRSSYICTCMKELFLLRVFRRGGIVLAARAKSFRQSGRKAVKHIEWLTTYKEVVTVTL